jgi:GxxExxY protein
MITKKYLDDLTYQVIGAAIEVHKGIGPGLLESVYEECLKHELNLRNISYRTKTTVPIFYKGIDLKTELFCDLFVERCLVAEVWSVNALLPVNSAQVMTYMKLLEAPKGLLLNFNCINIFKEGQKTFVNEYYRDLPDR